MKIPKLLKSSGSFPIYKKVPDCPSIVHPFTDGDAEKAMKQMLSINAKINKKYNIKRLLKDVKGEAGPESKEFWTELERRREKKKKK
jgi:hypothetical protein